MRSKAPLALMEQVVMVLVFALAAALCLQVFVFSAQASRRNEAIDHAVLEAQNAAEALKSGYDDYFVQRQAALNGNAGYAIAYDGTWQTVPAGSADTAYQLTTDIQSESEYLWSGEVAVYTTEGEELFRLPVAGQKEVAGNG